MESNLKRGNRLLFWMMSSLSMDLLIFLLLGICWIIFGPISVTDILAVVSLTFKGLEGFYAPGYVFMVFLIVGTTVLALLSMVMMELYFYLWFYRAIENLREVSRTVFHPAVAVVCSMIPLLGTIFMYFILMDMIKAQEREMDARNMEYKAVPKIILVLYTLVSVCFNFYVLLGSSLDLGLLDMMFYGVGIVGSIFCIFVVYSYICEEREFYKVVDQEIFTSRVEKILAERKLIAVPASLWNEMNKKA